MLQKLSGAEVERESQAAPNSWGTQFTGFTSTKVQILTQTALLGSAGQKTLISTDAQVERCAALLLLYCCFTAVFLLLFCCFTAARRR